MDGTITAESPALLDCHIAGLRIHRVSTSQAVETVDSFVRSRRPHQVVTVNLDFLRLAAREQRFRDVLNSADLAVADGMPLVWLSRMSGGLLRQRVTGVSLVAHCAELAAREAYRVFFLGAAPGVADEAAARLAHEHPGLRPPATYSPPYGEWTSQEQREIVERIWEAQADMLFVGLGAPKQDYWIREHLHELRVPVCVGVGGSFDILAGRIPRAPQWLQTAGLEWAYRLKAEPRRLWRRYLANDLPFLISTTARTIFFAR